MTTTHRPGLLPNGDLDPAVFSHLATADALAAGHTAGYQLGWHAGYYAGRAAQDAEDTAAWRALAAKVRALASQPTWAELQHCRGDAA
ncbi:MAG TPA: hypothetical protein VLJ59_08000 [Mycobacteriales bacterium]|nr:hypothetical protein [Mycobacteriales bacterium]